MPCCENPGSSWLLPPRSEQDGAGCGAGPGPRPPARPPPNPAALPAAAILPRADWCARPVRPAPFPGRRRGGERSGGVGPRAPGAPPPARPRRQGSGDTKPRAFRPRSSLEGERIDLSHVAGQGPAEVRTGKCPRGALLIPFLLRYKTAPCSGSCTDRASRAPNSHHRVRPFLDITGE